MAVIEKRILVCSFLFVSCLFFCAFRFLPAVRDAAFATVPVEGGVISGGLNVGGTIHFFKGIPFAAPPVGALRWKAPQAVQPWTGVRSCVAFGPSPMQEEPKPFSMWSEEFLIPKKPISEDCLSLNVWTGAGSAREKRPVIVWIYGGGFGSGGSAAPIYDGEAMAKKGIVFVSINYRVGIFGFFAHPELTKESGHHASGNYGLMDQVAGLKWVRQNIAAFGGDPGNVTIAGQSAGSMSVNCLVASPLAKGLFKRAIGESGAMFTNEESTLSKAEDEGTRIMRTLKASSLADLRAMSAEDLLTGVQEQWRPMIDGYVLPDAVVNIFNRGMENKADLLTGWNEDEGSMFRMQNDAWATIQARHGGNVYVYRFARKPPATGEYVKYGAFHTAEVPYAYDNLTFVNRPWEPVDHQLATQMSAYWANFAATGNPNGSGLPVWGKYTVKNKQTMVLDKPENRQFELKNGKYQLTLEGAGHFADLPLRCMQREFPYKTGIAFPDSSLAVKPKEYHPAFYGCFDWHSSVHGHWMLVRLLKLFPAMPRSAEIRQKLTENLSAENIQGEMKVFAMKDNMSFERTYGWAWLLQLESELLQWDDPLGRKLSSNVAPLARQLSGMFIDYLPKMNYPVRVGEHTNLAFALRLAWDYAVQAKDEPLKGSIRTTALRFYRQDVHYPFSWEPGGNDFLSPALEEADLMWRILPDTTYSHWVRRFLPAIAGKDFSIQPGQVTDRTDGKLVHLDGLNLSRAWDLYGIARHLPAHRSRLYAIANKHLMEALPNVASGDYMGEHWLASFAVYALTMQ